jgi:heat shock protein HslJ
MMTMMACLGENRDQLEQQHMAALAKVVTYQIDGDTLTLFDQQNVSLLQFVRVK